MPGRPAPKQRCGGRKGPQCLAIKARLWPARAPERGRVSDQKWQSGSQSQKVTRQTPKPTTEAINVHGYASTANVGLELGKVKQRLHQLQVVSHYNSSSVSKTRRLAAEWRDLPGSTTSTTMLATVFSPRLATSTSSHATIAYSLMLRVRS